MNKIQNMQNMICLSLAEVGFQNPDSEMKQNSDFPLYWLFNRDPYTDLLYNPNITG